MADSNIQGQYSLVAPFLTSFMPSWLSGNTVEQARIASYTLYENLYWNDAGGFRMVVRGDEEFPVYIPTARRIIKTLVRYIGRGWGYSIVGGDSTQQQAAQLAYDTLFKRERFYSLYNQQKRMGLIRGDWVFGLFADPNKPETRRISIVDVHPGKFFPIYKDGDTRSVLGQRIIEPITVGDKTYIRVQRWLKSTHPDHPSYNETAPDYEAPIAHDDTTFETESWDDPAKRKTFQVTTPTELLDGILTLPMYHIKNDAQPGEGYGTSDLKGLERIMFAVNQTATDEDTAIAMAGLGMYTADSSPVDDDGNATDWMIGPKRVVETPQGGKFERVSGVASVEPSQSHADWLQKQAESVFGISDVALGQVDVSVAESGIALALRMGPLLDEANERDQEIRDVLDQFLHDLKQWFLVYEGVNLGDDVTGVVLESVFEEKLPEDKKAQMDRLQQLFLDGVIPMPFYWQALRDLGLELPDDATLTQMFADQQSATDPQGARLAQEANTNTNTTDATSGQLQ
jgi:hypothetical protein